MDFNAKKENTMRTIIRNGRIITASDDYTADIYIEGEKIKYNYSTRLAIIEKGLVQSGQIVFPRYRDIMMR